MIKNPIQQNTLIELLLQRSQNQPDKRAYTFLADGETETASLTYAVLDQQARIIAAKLQSMVGIGERALLLYPSGLSYIAAFFGCLYANVIAVPAYPPRRNRSDQRLAAIAADAQAAVILTTTDIFSKKAQRLTYASELENLQWLATDSLAVELADSWQMPKIDSDTLAFLQYTSGSTGTPKGVMVSHGNLLHNCAYMTSIWHSNAESVMVTWLPIFHDMGLIFGILQPLYQGFPCYVMSSTAFVQRPFRWLQAISRLKATHSGAPNFAYDLCVNKITEEQRATLDLSRWEMSVNGAEPVRAQTFRKFSEYFKRCGLKLTTLCHGYGLAEATLVIGGAKKLDLPTYYQIQSEALEQNCAVAVTENQSNTHTLVGCGHPADDAEVIIVNPNTLTRCPPNYVGEIWLKSPSVAHGYWQRPVETAETFQAYVAETGEGPFLRTGDLGFLREDGELFVTGRLKDVIIIRGNNYYPQDIELTLENCHTALRSSGGAAFSIEIAGTEQLVIIQEVERTALKKLNVNEVINTIRQAVSEQHDLQVYAILLLKPATLPKTSSGKVQRSACREGFLTDTLKTVARWQQTISIEKSVTHQNSRSVTVESLQTWLLTKLSEQLKMAVSEIDIREPLARYGLDSMIAVSLSGELETWLERPLSPTIVYDYPSIQALSQYLAGEPSYSQKTKTPLELTTATEAIAIIGMGCRFPSAENPQAFWQILHEGKEAITEVPASRWDINADPNLPGKMNTRWGGFLEDVAGFDPLFFSLSPLEAQKMDPQQRLLLEVSWEALENAGIAPNKLAGSETGVFIGISTNDYARLQSKHNTTPDIYSNLGSASSIAANRLSYLWDLRGPSIAIDTACSSSLVAVHQACQSLRLGECDLALAGGVNLILTPDLTITFSQVGMLAADGHCKTFDANADGYVRGEGCGMIVLKRFSEAVRDGDNILALIKGSAINQDGRTNGLTAPNSLSQQAVVRRALKNAGIAPNQINYVEAHGTGTSLGDPIEVNALKEVLMEGRTVEQPCWIGSVKTNIGHLEAAAGIAGLIKVVLSLQNEEIFPHLHLNELNPLIKIAETPLSIPTDLTQYQPHFAGISSFGYGGTNAHVVLEKAHTSEVLETSEVFSKRHTSEVLETSEVLSMERSKHLLTLSAKNESALRALAQRYETYLDSNSQDTLANICFTANTGRTQFNHRLAIVADNTTQLREQLNAFRSEKSPIEKGFRGVLKSNHKPPKIAFLFTGQGSQYVGLGRELYETQPIFRQTLERCDNILRDYLEQPLLEIIYLSLDDHSKLDETVYTQPALFALEYALAELWQSWGIKPTYVMGHSVGEYVAACVAGVFSLEDGLKLIAERARLMQALPHDGEMVTAFASVAIVATAIQPYTRQVSIAAINGPENIVISGRRDAINTIRTTLEVEGISIKSLNVSHAFHSPLMEPMLADFESIARKITFGTPKIDLISNLTGERATADITTPEYWCRHIRQPVRFASSLETLYQLCCEVFVEIGPKPALLGMGRQCLPENVGVWLPSLRQGEDDWQQLLQSLGELYVRGTPIDWSGFDRDYQRSRVILPTYPFQRQRYWFDSPVATTQNAQLQDWLYQVEWQPQARFGQPIDYLPTPSEINANLKSDVANVLEQISFYETFQSQIEALSVDFILNAFQQMGWTWAVSQRFKKANIASILGVVRQHQRLLGRLLEILAEEKILQQHGEEWQVIFVPVINEPPVKMNQLLTQYPQANAELILLERCGSQLAEILRGTCDPLSVLFPNNDLTQLTQLYQDSAGPLAMNTIVQKVVSMALARLPQGRGVRVLEIGAGTGGTTTYILPHLPVQQTEYVFTDISSLFTTKAAEKFADYPFVRYQALDIEQSPSVQGFGEHEYDIIVAANVLHATKDLTETLQHVYSLLAPGGMLILMEGTGRQRWLDLTFGLLEGWWRFTDQHLRPNYPLLSATQWQSLLQEQGFTQPIILPGEENKALQQAVIVAQIAPLSSQLPVRENEQWLIFADTQGVGLQFSKYLQNQSAGYTLVLPGKAYKQVDEQTLKIDHTNPEHFQQLLETLSTKPSRLRGIVHCWSLDTVTSEQLTSEDLASAGRLSCGSLLYLVQALGKANFSEPPSLWLVTQAAMPVALPNSDAKGQLPIINIAQSPLWGMGKVIALEHPELNCVRIDLDPEMKGDEAQALFEEIHLNSQEDQIAFRQNARYVPRLVHYQNKKAFDQVDSFFHADSTYLITGGLGGLGLQVANWMVEQGAKHLVLVGRSGAKAAVHNQLEALEQTGATIRILKSDVSQAKQVAQVLAEIEQSLPPLRGIIHAAGVLNDGVLMNQTWKRFSQVFAPKVQGAWNLHALTSHLSLDFSVLFSSVSALLGSKAQANHAAANSFLDALAFYRQAQGLPGLSINWGTWSEIGAAAQRGADEQLKQKGIAPITPKLGLQVLKKLFLTQASVNAIAQVGVAPIDWSRFIQQWPAVPPLFAELVHQEQQQDKSPLKATLINQLQTAFQQERRSLLIDYLQAQVAESLGLSQPDIQQPLNNLGLDSLMAVELRNYIRTQLGVELTIGTILTGATFSELATEIELQLATTEIQTNQTHKNNIIEQLPGHQDDLASQSSNDPKIILYCLPFAGGHTLSYRDFQAHVAESILIKPLELPGRGQRINEPGLTNLETMADDVFEQIQSDLNDTSYAIYGHSMGATLGYLLIKRILNAGKPAPTHLFVSGRKAPSVLNDVPPMHQLPKQAFLNQINELGGLPPSIEGDAELMDFFEPILRADIQALETYIYQPTSPFDIPITILQGLTDGAVAYQNLLPWQQESTQPIAIQTLKGGHFFIFEQLSGLGELFSRTLINTKTTD